MIAGLAICLGMIRLGVWQLDRAAQVQAVLQKQQARAAAAEIDLVQLVNGVGGLTKTQQRYRRVSAVGQYAAAKSIFVDNQVTDGKVGYILLTPLKLANSDWWVLVDRGWLPVGESRKHLPVFKTASESVTISGRLALPISKPPLWSSDYPVATGNLWQYLPIDEYANQMQLKLLPLVLELAPNQNTELESSLVRERTKIDDRRVAKHNAYAFQWFAMAAAFFVACAILVLRGRGFM